MNQNLFAELPLVPELLRAIGEMGFSEPTPIQAQSIPLILEGRDVVGRSQTGTGKTAAFGIPAIQMVDPNLDRRMAQILLLCPTRELAVQACEELKKLAHPRCPCLCRLRRRTDRTPDRSAQGCQYCCWNSRPRDGSPATPHLKDFRAAHGYSG